MARILVTWQLGGGLRHLVPLWPLVRGLCERGHRVFAALKDLSRAGAVFGRIGVSYLQAPFRLGRVENQIERPRTFAQVLHNVAFGDVEELRTLGDARRNLYDYVQPDLILFDHSPTALLMAGKPILQLPIYLEQMLNAAATVRLGAGWSARINRPEEIAVKLMALLCSESHAEAAVRFAKRHANFGPGHQIDKAVRRIEELAS